MTSLRRWAEYRVPPVDQGGDVVGQLEGGELAALLADGHRQGATLVPGLPHGLSVLRSGHDAGLLIQLDAGGLPEAEFGGKLLEPLNAHPAAHIEEEYVAGDLQRLGHIHQAVLAPVLAPIPALGAVVLIIRVDASVHDLGIRLNDPALQSGDSGDHLKGGAGGIDTLESTVQEGLEGIGAVLRQIGRVGGQVIGGVGGGGQHLCPVHVHHHAGCALCVLTGQLGNSLGEDVLHLLLKVDVDGEHHVVPPAGGAVVHFSDTTLPLVFRSTSRTPAVPRR